MHVPYTTIDYSLQYISPYIRLVVLRINYLSLLTSYTSPEIVVVPP